MGSISPGEPLLPKLAWILHRPGDEEVSKTMLFYFTFSWGVRCTNHTPCVHPAASSMLASGYGGCKILLSLIKPWVCANKYASPCQMWDCNVKSHLLGTGMKPIHIFFSPRNKYLSRTMYFAYNIKWKWSPFAHRSCLNRWKSNLDIQTLCIMSLALNGMVIYFKNVNEIWGICKVTKNNLKTPNWKTSARRKGLFYFSLNIFLSTFYLQICFVTF